MQPAKVARMLSSATISSRATKSLDSTCNYKISDLPVNASLRPMETMAFRLSDGRFDGSILILPTGAEPFLA